MVDLASSHIHRLPALEDLGVLSPVWSPDGTRDALAVTDGISLRPAIIDVQIGAMRVVSERNLTLTGTRTFFHLLDDAALACESTVGAQAGCRSGQHRIRDGHPSGRGRAVPVVFDAVRDCGGKGQRRPAVLWVYPGFDAGSDMGFVRIL
ncbi:hypothetical protein [Martelella limonii]|uniref:hypothetical protein n=1 Tax=Martelella limonii TaxID=1647649 RepID=UPI0015800AC6|nr:hypothetical protein [Martelella limonii]